MTQDGPSPSTPAELAGAAPRSEHERATILASYSFETIEDDDELNAIVRFAASLCDAQIALVSIVETEEQRFIARTGIEARSTPRSQSFCAYAMLGADTMVVEDAANDPRFAGNELVTGPPHIRFYAGAPLVSQGVPLGALCVIDTAPRPGGLTDLQREGLEVLRAAALCRLCAHRDELGANRRANESARAMREIADMVPGIVWSADAGGTFDYFNSRWTRTTGAANPATLADWRPHVHPDDAERTLAVWQVSFADGKPFESEYRLKQLDGSWRWTLARALPMLDQGGQVMRWYGTLTDIDEGHRRSENRDLVARELSHRIKNIFAVVAGLVSLRARRVPEAAEFAADLNATIRALGRAHDFVRPIEGARGGSLCGLLGELMAPYVDGEDRIRMVGDDCPIGARAATPLALIFHELATNSAKYGGLSVPAGSVEIGLDCTRPDGNVHIAWREHGGPPPDGLGAEGFGTRLVKMSIEGQLGGKMERRFLPGGLEVDLIIPSASMLS